MRLGRMDCFAITDRGQLRSKNEDQYLVADLVKAARIQSTTPGHEDATKLNGNPQGKLMLVADGMGGHDDGERASQLATDHTVSQMMNQQQWSALRESSTAWDESILEGMQSVVQECHDAIRRESTSLQQNRQMGTTLTAAIVNWPTLYLAHVGDSRCYLIRDGLAEQITTDHTWAQAMSEWRDPGSEDCHQPRLSSCLWNVLGGASASVHVDTHKIDLCPGDSIVLCTDGLTDHMTDQDIGEIMRSSRTAKQACEDFVDEANRAGGSDNITVVVARFHSMESAMRIASSKFESAFELDQEHALVC